MISVRVFGGLFRESRGHTYPGGLAQELVSSVSQVGFGKQDTRVSRSYSVREKSEFDAAV